jgi:hypothetical protein
LLLLELLLPAVEDAPGGADRTLVGPLHTLRLKIAPVLPGVVSALTAGFQHLAVSPLRHPSLPYTCFNSLLCLSAFTVVAGVFSPGCGGLVLAAVINNFQVYSFFVGKCNIFNYEHFYLSKSLSVIFLG